ncbi:dynein intermediate chain 3, ciliary-like [Daphnia pulicaria]|uniref:dynein intermediate chain 3, ciliary-like n=1 Tax=Daphnia pulicaria TaxID=35523 RepID=UPI001EE9C7E1|nr:dynein intermediate chain 3, ciliary-like [Daphnia pulicaria]
MDLTCVVRRDIKLLSKRKCNFSDAVFHSSQSVDIFPDRELTASFTIAKNKEIGVQCQACDISALHINTECASTENRGVYHKEGGWPRDVNPHESDQTARYRKKIEKDEAYSHAVLNLGQQMEHYIKQNNVFNIYEDYFTDAPDVQTPDPNPLRTIHMLKDPSPIKRAVTGLSWSPDGGTKLAAAYSDPFWKNLFDYKENDSYIWNIERAVQPEVVLRSMSQLRSVSFNPRDQHILAGGTIFGAVGIWDVRKSQGPVECVPIGVGHSESVTSLIWSNSKAGGEFFSASGDGQVLWWDMRKLNAPIDAILLDPSSNPRSESALSASCLEYDPSMPNKFLVGTRQGIVMNCNRRARTTAERIMCQYEAHLGPVHGLHRHPQLPKIFLTVGDWTTNVWTEDIRDSPILTLKNQNVQLLAGAWSYTRPSVIFTAATDGALYLWDILAQRLNPTLCTQVSDSPLLSLSTQEQGKIMAVGSKDGRLSVIQISENLSSVTKNDKAALTSLLERETRREKTLEQRTKDGKGKQGSKTASGFHMAVTSVTQSTGSLVVQQPPSPTSPSKKMFESLKETLQALNNKENTSDNEAVQNGIEPSADMMPAVDNQGSQINLSISQPVEPTVDQTLQSAEDAFFETMNQDILSRGIDDK